MESLKLQRMLEMVRFRDPEAAAHSLGQMEARPDGASLLEQHGDLLAYALQQSASPDRALLGLVRLLVPSGEHADIVHSLLTRPESLRPLLTILGASQLLGELLIREPGLVHRLENLPTLARARSSNELEAELAARLQGLPAAEQPDAMRRWQQQELFRIGSCDLLGMLDHVTVTMQLSRLADTLIRHALLYASEGTAGDPGDLTVLALGKLGGAELNYSSDIDLLFLARDDAASAMAMGEALIEALAARTARGFLYRVDMRLRPWGRSGPLVMTADGYEGYLRRHARPWERQALLKARPVAGALALGQELLGRVAGLVYATPQEEARVTARDLKQRIERGLERRGRQWGEVKAGIGSLRDIEFVAQVLQLGHGQDHPAVSTPNTLEALSRLCAAGLLASEDYRTLSEGYRFLRPVEHYIQLMHGRQSHSLPTDPDELAYLGRRLGFSEDRPGDQLVARYEAHAAAVRAVYERHVDQDPPASLSTPPGNGAASVERHVQRMAPSYADTFAPDEIQRHVVLADRLGPENLVEVDAAPLGDDTWRVTVVAYEYRGELAAICGLLTAHGCDIREGSVFRYDREIGAAESARRKIVDVFVVHRPVPQGAEAPWVAYRNDLAGLLGYLEAHEPRTAQAELMRMVAPTVSEGADLQSLQPIFIDIDNEASDRYTVLHIDAPDTPGFLYEFASALAVLGYDIGRMTVTSRGTRVVDILYLTDRQGRKIIPPERQRELRAATVLVKHFTHLLPHAPDPGRAITHFRDLVGQLLSRPDWPTELASLTSPPVLEGLARLLGVSDFLWNDLLRVQHENLFPLIRDVEALSDRKTIEQLQAELAAELARQGDDFDARAKVLNAFKDREIFRTDLRHIQGHLPSFAAFAEELSDVAEVVVRGAFDLCHERVHTRHGAPLLDDTAPAPMAVLALGKLGGREIGYASDIELLFLYAGKGQTEGPETVDNATFYEELVRCFLRVIRTRREGIFELDLRLRPYGEAGSLAVSQEAFQRYFGPGGVAWPYERQALVRLRPIAGDPDLGQQALALRDAYVYRGDPPNVAAIRAMRERQLRHLVAGGARNAKFSRGGLVDVEYLVQALQMRHGSQHASVRSPNTQQTMQALAEIGILSAEDHARLREAHLFLRHLIDALRMVRGNARDLTVPPQESDEFTFLARRCGYGDDAELLQQDLDRHMAAVEDLVARLLT